MAKTIAAISTAMAPGGIGIVRISGDNAKTIVDKVFRTKSGKWISEMKGYTAALGEIWVNDSVSGAAELEHDGLEKISLVCGEPNDINEIDNINNVNFIHCELNDVQNKLDDAVALVFTAPKSYTGEDVVELSCHGGLYVLKRLLQELLANGAEPAQAGEFTKRAFLNGKMDLIQAESVMQIISAGGEQAARAAIAGNDGKLSEKIMQIKAEITDTAAHLAAWADFPDDDIPQIEENELKTRLSNAVANLTELLKSFEKGKILRDGVITVIAGRPNAGKSTLMNLLAGCERSIVTEIAGTTRDVVEESIMLGGISLRLADTAGIRETDDIVESIGVNAAKKRIETAQLILVVFDASQKLNSDDMAIIENTKSANSIAIINKTDLEMKIDESLIRSEFSRVISISAALGDGLQALETEITSLLETEKINSADGLLYTERQRKDVFDALSSIQQASGALESGLTLDAATVCVEDALESLCELTGERVSDKVIGEVFEQFCVGK